MNARYVRHLFYVYTEASSAVACAVAALIEFGCALALPDYDPFSGLGYIVASFFLTLGMLFALHVYREERRYNREVL